MTNMNVSKLFLLVLLPAACAGLAPAQSTRDFRQIFAVSRTAPVVLAIDLAAGELHVAYSRDGEVSITSIANMPSASSLEEDALAKHLKVTQSGNHIEIVQNDSILRRDGIKMLYRIDVPYWTEVRSILQNGKQVITGIMGPVSARIVNGNIVASYISKGVDAQAGAGDIDLQVIGDRIEAKTGRGNIACSRAAQGISAESGDGDISLTVVGSAEAIIKSGTGRIDATGVRSTLSASTDAGDLRVRAVAHDDWKLQSVSGNIHIDLPPRANFDLDVATDSGELSVHRDDVDNPPTGIHILQKKVNGGGKHIVVTTISGRITIG